MRFISNVLAGMISFVYFFVLMVFAGLLFASNVFSAEYYASILNNMELSEIKISDLEELGLSEVEGYSGEDTLEDVFVGWFVEAGLSEKDAEAIVGNEKINDTAGKLISDTVMYMVNEENVPQLDDDIKEIFAMEEVANILDEQPSEEEIEELVDEINIEIEKLFKEEFTNAE